MWLQRLIHATAVRWHGLRQWPGSAAPRDFSEPLEQRLQHAAEPLGLAASMDGLTHDDADRQAEVLKGDDGTSASARRLTVLFAVDLRVLGADSLITDLEAAAPERGENLQLLLLDSLRAGLEQITEALQRHQRTVDAVQLVSHAQPGQWLLGASLVDAERLETPSGMLQSQARWTSADVADSDHCTGYTRLGGDWTLGDSTGLNTTGAPFSAGWMAAWSHRLATFTVTSGAGDIDVDTTEDSADGDTSSLANVQADRGADGVISLREAITAANNTPNDGAGPDRICLNVAGTGTGTHLISITTALPSITDVVLIDATTDEGFAANGNRPAIVPDGNDITAFNLQVDAGTVGNLIQGNSVGTDASGVLVQGHGGHGVRISAASSATMLGGVSVGKGNQLASQGGAGVAIEADAAAGHAVLGNRFSANVGLVIDLSGNGIRDANDTDDADDADGGPNLMQNHPVLVEAYSSGSSLAVYGELTSTPGQTFRSELFSSPTAQPTGSAQGAQFLGSVDVITEGAGSAGTGHTLTSVNVPVGRVVTAMATRRSGPTSYLETSELLSAVSALSTTQTTVTVITASDVEDGDVSSVSTLLSNPGADGAVSLREALSPPTTRRTAQQGPSARCLPFPVPVRR
jgi:hypothetical protein